MIDTIIITRLGDSYHTRVASVDGTKASQMTGSVGEALAAATTLAAVQLSADEPNPTPGQVVRGGKQPEFCVKDQRCLLRCNHPGKCRLRQAT